MSGLLYYTCLIEQLPILVNSGINQGIKKEDKDHRFMNNKITDMVSTCN